MATTKPSASASLTDSMPWLLACSGRVPDHVFIIADSRGRQPGVCLWRNLRRCGENSCGGEFCYHRPHLDCSLCMRLRENVRAKSSHLLTEKVMTWNLIERANTSLHVAFNLLRFDFFLRLSFTIHRIKINYFSKRF